MKPSALSIRVDSDLREQAEGILQDIGMTVSEAVTVFLKQVVYHSGIPFELKRPRFNAETEVALLEGQAILRGDIESK